MAVTHHPLPHSAYQGHTARLCGSWHRLACWGADLGGVTPQTSAPRARGGTGQGRLRPGRVAATDRSGGCGERSGADAGRDMGAGIGSHLLRGNHSDSSKERYSRGKRTQYTARAPGVKQKTQQSLDITSFLSNPPQHVTLLLSFHWWGLPPQRRRVGGTPQRASTMFGRG
jgi:hypothetical protein